MAWKVAIHKKYALGASRKSTDMPSETTYSVYTARDNMLYHDNLKNFSSTKPPVKKVGEEIKRPSNRQNAPSVVARLMGVDMLPFDSKISPQTDDTKIEILTSPHQQMANSLWCNSYSDNCGSQLKLKPKKREHPQEEELQKFKKQFEAWQAARFSECSKVLKCRNAPYKQLSNEEPNRERRLLYADCKRIPYIERFKEHMNLAEQIDKQEFTLGSCKRKKLLSPNLLTLTPKLNSASALSKIVLRAGSDRIDIDEDSLNNTPVGSVQKGSIKDFLEEVRERLKSEYQGKFTRSTTIRGGGIETPYREKPPSESIKIARDITHEVRISGSRDSSMDMLQSESTRSPEGKIQINERGCPESNSRRFVASKMMSIMNGETEKEIPVDDDHFSTVYTSESKKVEAGQQRGTWIENEGNFLYGLTDKLDRQSWSFRRYPDEGEVYNQDLSPSHLTRSLSAPVSTKSVEKLLTEHKSLMTGEEIRWNPEASEKAYVNIKKQKKDKLSIKEKVSNIGHSLILRGFGKRVKSPEVTILNENNVMRDDTCCTTATTTYFDEYENSTEVPPSPASVCSSVHEDFWRVTDNLSPIMPSNGTLTEDINLPYVLKEINLNLNELRRKLNQLEGHVTEEPPNNHQHTETELQVHDEAETFVRELLTAAGFDSDTSTWSLLKWDPLSKPISSCIFNEVEETFKQKAMNVGRSYSDENNTLNRKIILDLVNEVLPMVLKEPTVNLSKYMKQGIGTMPSPPQGMTLLSQVWSIIQELIHPLTDRSSCSVDNMVARDFCSNPWLRCIDDDINGIVRDTERYIMKNMIGEVVQDMLLLP